MSRDGWFVAFVSGATDLVAGDTNDYWDAFVHDRRPSASIATWRPAGRTRRGTGLVD
jgi:hypothetical protein